ncbi:MAG: hypothetical protein LBU32_14620 [Clostridiales bacterium]|nr:hypothetical protein [Clostridiales bacterium]
MDKGKAGHTGVLKTGAKSARLKYFFMLSVASMLLISCNDGETAAARPSVKTGRQSETIDFSVASGTGMAEKSKVIEFSGPGGGQPKSSRWEIQTVIEFTNLENYASDNFGSVLSSRFDETNFPLFAALKSEGLFLYGINPRGMILVNEGRGTYFDWPSSSGAGELPVMRMRDFDADGENELAVVLTIQSGSGVVKEELHLLDGISSGSKDENPVYEESSLDLNASAELLNSSVSLRKRDGELILALPGFEYAIGLEGALACAAEEAELELHFGNVIDYIFDGEGLKLRAAAFARNGASQLNLGEIAGRVAFHEGMFSFEDLQFNVSGK